MDEMISRVGMVELRVYLAFHGAVLDSGRRLGGW